LIFEVRAQSIYWKKISSSTNGAGKTRYSPVEEWN
jgi:hypothetical protein